MADPGADEPDEFRDGLGLIVTGFGGRRIVGLVSGPAAGRPEGDDKPVQPE